MQLLMAATIVLFSLTMGKMDAGEGRQRQKRVPGDLIFVYPITAEQQQEIVNKHNSLRRNVSNPMASNMRQMYWDNALAQLASVHAEKCTLEHSVGQRTQEFATVGENTGKSGASNYKNIIQQWFDEVSDYTYSSGSCAAGKKCGHYTQVVWATSYKIGCAYALCSNLIGVGVQGYVYVCNYGPAGNQLQQGSQTLLEKPYKSGSPCSECQAGLTCVDQLCADTTLETMTTTRKTTEGLPVVGGPAGTATQNPNYNTTATANNLHGYSTHMNTLRLFIVLTIILIVFLD